MKVYIGIKSIQAEPMNRGDYNIYKQWKLPDNQRGDDEGYLVKYPDGYESWSPKEQFEIAYMDMDDLMWDNELENSCDVNTIIDWAAKGSPRYQKDKE